MSAPTTEQSLDELLRDLVQNADDWAALKSDLIDSPTSPSSADGQAHPCFDQLSRAISSHVTDLLMRRLRLAGHDGVDDNEDTDDDEQRPWIDERGRERRGRGFPQQQQLLHQQHRLGSDSLRSSRGSLSSRDSPSSSGGAAASGRGGASSTMTTTAPPAVTPRGRAQARTGASGGGGPPSAMGSRAGSTCSIATIGTRYHSENRLDRACPAARPGETPLENRASRLRRMSIERRQAERSVRSAAASPMPQRRALSRRSSGCDGQ